MSKLCNCLCVLDAGFRTFFFPERGFHPWILTNSFRRLIRRCSDDCQTDHYISACKIFVHPSAHLYLRASVRPLVCLSAHLKWHQNPAFLELFCRWHCCCEGQAIKMFQTLVRESCSQCCAPCGFVTSDTASCGVLTSFTGHLTAPPGPFLLPAHWYSMENTAVLMGASYWQCLAYSLVNEVLWEW